MLQVSRQKEQRYPTIVGLLICNIGAWMLWDPLSTHIIIQGATRIAEDIHKLQNVLHLKMGETDRAQILIYCVFNSIVVKDTLCGNVHWFLNRIWFLHLERRNIVEGIIISTKIPIKHGTYVWENEHSRGDCQVLSYQEKSSREIKPLWWGKWCLRGHLLFSLNK